MPDQNPDEILPEDVDRIREFYDTVYHADAADKGETSHYKRLHSRLQIPDNANVLDVATAQCAAASDFWAEPFECSSARNLLFAKYRVVHDVLCKLLSLATRHSSMLLQMRGDRFPQLEF